MALGLGVEAALEVGRVRLQISRAVPGMGIVVLVDAAGGEHGAVDALEVAAVGQVQSPDHVGAHRLLLVVLAPVDVGAAGAAGCVEDVRGLYAVELGQDALAVLHADRRRKHLLALLLQDALQVARHPALAAPDEEAVCLGSVGCHCCLLQGGMTK